MQVCPCKPGLGGALLPRKCDNVDPVSGKPCPPNSWVVLGERSRYVDQQTLKLQVCFGSGIAAAPGFCMHCPAAWLCVCLCNGSSNWSNTVSDSVWLRMMSGTVAQYASSVPWYASVTAGAS